MEVAVTSSLEQIIIGATGLEEIIQCVKIILSTVQGQVPMDRDFGVDGGMIDEPISVIAARRAADIVAAVEKYEPRVQVVRVDWDTPAGSIDGRMMPVVVIRVKEGGLL